MIEKPAKRRDRFLKNERGQFHLIWLWLVGFLVYALLNRGIEMLLALGTHAIRAYLTAMALQGELQTPLWAITIFTFYDPILTIAESVATIFAFSWLSRRFRLSSQHHAFEFGRMLKWLPIGIIGAVAGVTLCLMTDSLRMEWPLNEPGVSVTTAVLLPMCFLSTMAGEIFAMDYLYESARLHTNRVVSIILVAVVEFIAEGGWHLHPIGMVNVVLQVIICCMMHERYGLAAPLGLWAGWNYILQAIFVHGGGVWSLYHVSEAWLTGDGHLIFGGAWATLFMLCIVMWLLHGRKKRFPY